MAVNTTPSPAIARAYFSIFCDSVTKYAVGHQTDRHGRYRRKNTGKFDVSATRTQWKTSRNRILPKIRKIKFKAHFAYPSNARFISFPVISLPEQFPVYQLTRTINSPRPSPAAMWTGAFLMCLSSTNFSCLLTIRMQVKDGEIMAMTAPKLDPEMTGSHMSVPPAMIALTHTCILPLCLPQAPLSPCLKKR